jgi:hypothetical protein
LRQLDGDLVDDTLSAALGTTVGRFAMSTYPVGQWAAGAFAPLWLAGLLACSSGAAAPADAGAGTSPPDAGTNPDGVPYPSPAGGYGRTARSGTTPGSVIQNFHFQGYLNGDATQPLTTISLADYYDPCNKTYKLLHLSVAGVWCVPCDAETTAVVAAKSDLDAERVVFLQALDDGPTEGVPATVSDLNHWIQVHDSNFTEMLDPGLANLAGFFPAASVPWNCDIDPRTMEIIDASEGWPGDVDTEIAPGLSGLPAMPSYPLPASVTCN